ncbi:c-type cytochrome [Methylacidiphilum caldifontis]|uniref:multiheme c-type cytochrome n=1 Tax=Methylacidiphilum caldifontis TaxID=2795386 RepID=UPI001A8E04A9|nr:multiheme c-type cytochrome [Methylacidiphilum caldifontis]QSR88007.1 c-type cytochrome [Methylacidiphilum caldifontis]
MAFQRVLYSFFVGSLSFYTLEKGIAVGQQIENNQKVLLAEWLQNSSSKLALNTAPLLSKDKEEQNGGSGKEVFSRSCAGCHQQTGAGLTGVFPPLAGHIPEIMGSKKAKDYLIDVVLFGVEGPIQVGDQRYNGSMPGWANVFNDQQIADVLNYVINRWGAQEKRSSNNLYVSSEDVKMHRKKSMTAYAVWTSRPKELSVKLANVPEEDLNSLIKGYDQSHPAKGIYAQYWEPIPVERYWNPKTFYHPPQTIKGEVSRTDCITCHKSVTPGVFHAWEKSTHGQISSIRQLSDQDPKAYKKKELEAVEKQLRDAGVLKINEHLKEVSCIDCHGAIGAQKIRHDVDLHMPDRVTCGSCHVKQFAESEAERKQKWPNNEWPQGHPSHAVDWEANVNLAAWAAMPERAVAQGCDMCHYQQNRCDGCHTRHSFSAAEARNPLSCSTCHNGVDHNEFENYMLSKHGTIFQVQGKNWNFELPLKEAMTKGAYTAPTCASCHFEYHGEYSHNLVRKVRWAFNPTPEIAQGIKEKHPWYQQRKEDWITTCSACHSARFASDWLDTADQAIFDGLKVQEEAKKVVEALYKDGLLVGQKTNRPAPPPPEKDSPGAFSQLFWAKDNNPSHVERVYANMWEHDMIQHYKGVMHENPGGFTYSAGWGVLLERYTEIMDENTRLRGWAKSKPLSDKKDSPSPFARKIKLFVGIAGSGLGAFLLSSAFLSIMMGKKKK